MTKYLMIMYYYGNYSMTRIINTLISLDLDAGTHAYLPEATVTTVTTGGTFVPILGSFVNSPINKFSVVGGALRYDGTQTQYFEIDWSASISSVDAGRTVHVGMAKNAEVLTTLSPSAMGIYVKYADEIISLSGTNVISMATNDTVQLQTTSSADLDEVTFNQFITTIRPFLLTS